MKAVLKMKLGVLAAGFLMSFTMLAPPAHAHACYGSGTITIKQIGKDYWYFQNGRVCGRYVT